MCSSLEGVPGARDACGVDYGGACDLGSGEAVREEGGSVGWSIAWAGWAMRSWEGRHGYWL
jgi:hypothetical protein